jgi:chromosome segregation ATPase
MAEPTNSKTTTPQGLPQAVDLFRVIGEREQIRQQQEAAIAANDETLRAQDAELQAKRELSMALSQEVAQVRQDLDDLHAQRRSLKVELQTVRLAEDEELRRTRAKIEDAGKELQRLRDDIAADQRRLAAIAANRMVPTH